MDWDGSTVNLIAGVPDTKPAIEWTKVSDGNYEFSDRGISEDIYLADIVFEGPSDELSTLENELHDNRKNFDITCGTGEEIFGADIDYSGALDVTVDDYGVIERQNKGMYIIRMRLRLLDSPSFLGTASLSSLMLADHKYQAYSDFDVIKGFTLAGTANYLDGKTDPGVFRGTFRQSFTEMKNIRRYLLSTTGRTASVSFPSIGVDYPFGQRMGTGPFSCKIIQWKDMGQPNFVDWMFSATFAREF